MKKLATLPVLVLAALICSPALVMGGQNVGACATAPASGASVGDSCQTRWFTYIPGGAQTDSKGTERTWKGEINVVSQIDADQSFSILLFDSAGTPLSAYIEEGGNIVLGVGGSFSLKGKQTKAFTITAAAKTVQGIYGVIVGTAGWNGTAWIQNLSVTGASKFVTASGLTSSYAGYPAADLAMQFSVPIQIGANTDSGIAIVAPTADFGGTSRATTVSARLFDGAANPATTAAFEKTVTLNPGQQWVGLGSDLLAPYLASKNGVMPAGQLVISTDQPVALTASLALVRGEDGQSFMIAGSSAYLPTDVGSLQSQVVSLQADNRALQSSMASLQASMAALSASTSSLSSQVSTHSSQLVSLSQQSSVLASSVAQIQALSAQSSASLQQVFALLAQFAATEAQLASAQAQINALVAQLASGTPLTGAQQAQLAALQATVSSLTSQLSSLAAQLGVTRP